MLRDAQGCPARFGPIGESEMVARYGPKFTPEQVVKDMQSAGSIEALLDAWDMNFGYTVSLTRDIDPISIEIWERIYGDG